MKEKLWNDIRSVYEHRAWHYGYNFITIDEIRNGKLEELGI